MDKRNMRARLCAKIFSGGGESTGVYKEKRKEIETKN